MAGEEIPTFKNPDIQMLIQDFTQVRKDLNDERRSSEKKLKDERERSAWEVSRVRAEFEEKIRGILFENDGLVRSLGRVHGENCRLRDQVSALQFKLCAPVSEAPSEKPKNEAVPGPFFPTVTPATSIPVDGSGFSSLGKHINIRKD